MLPAKSTVAPVIIATDKTQLTHFSGGKAAYPIYLTIGNIPKAVRRKPSRHSCILIGYLSVDKVSRKGLNDMQHRSRVQRIFHESMKIILEPLKKAGKVGVMMESSDGSVRRVHPILTSYVADYPEQCLVTCSKYGTCPKCQVVGDELGQLKDPPDSPRTGKWTTGVIKEGLQKAGATNHNHRTFHQHCMENGVTGGVFVPFWEDFPFTDIHRITTPDVLHQLYQGVLKHLVGWAQQVVGKDELDARIRSLPQMTGVRHFKTGISALSQISGTERKNMAKILLCAVADVMPSRGVKAVKAFLDFLYLAQYSTHDDDTLKYLRAALKEFHQYADFFITMGCRDHLNLPKLHSLIHYIESIEFFGTTDNYNTEMFERLHIDFAKYGWRATNQRDEFPQMINWLSRQEKIGQLEKDIESRLAFKLPSDKSPSNLPQPFPPTPEPIPHNNDGPTLTISKRPPHPARPIDHIIKLHCSPEFGRHLAAYLKTFIAPPSIRADNLTLPFERLNVWTVLRINPAPLHDDPSEQELVRAEPISNKNSVGRFDLVLVKEDEEADTVEVTGTRVGQVKVIFTLPTTLVFPGSVRSAPKEWPTEPLAYVEWFTRFGPKADKNTGMYKVSRAFDSQNRRLGAVIPLSSIRQACMLCPVYGSQKEKEWGQREWTPTNILNKATNFYLNNFHSKYAYQTLY